MKKFYYSKLDGYVPVIDEDESLTAAYKKNCTKRSEDGVYRDKDGNILHEGFVLADSFHSAAWRVREMFSKGEVKQ